MIKEKKMLEAENDRFEKLKDLAHKKVELMDANELHDFVMGYTQIIQEVCKTEYSFDDLRTCIEFRVMAYNNAHLGRKDFGGDQYKRCVITIYNQELSPREMFFKLKWLCPSGVTDGSSKHGNSELEYTYMLTDEDIAAMKRYGGRYYFKDLFKIKDILDYDNDFPFEMIESKHGGI
jgi:hypothetical protein